MNLKFDTTLEKYSIPVKVGNHKNVVDFEFPLRVCHPTAYQINLIDRLEPLKDVIKLAGYTPEQVKDRNKKGNALQIRMAIHTIVIWDNIKVGDKVYDTFNGNIRLAKDYEYTVNTKMGDHKAIKLPYKHIIKGGKPRRVDFNNIDNDPKKYSSIFIRLNSEWDTCGDLYTYDDDHCHGIRQIYYFMATLQGKILKNYKRG